MPGEIIIKGHLKWIIPLLIIIASSVFTLYTSPNREHFTNSSKKNKIEKILSEDKQELEELELKLEKLKKKLKSSDRGGLEVKTTKPVKIDDDDEQIDIDIAVTHPATLKDTSKVPEIKEGFEALEATNVEVLRKNWRKEDLPRTLEPYNGPIQGYNCGLYSKFTLDHPKSCLSSDSYGECNARYISPPSTDPSDSNEYIFPGRPVNKTGCIQYAAKPNILEYESDVNQKILEYESMNILPDYNPKHVEHLERPQFMYHRRDGEDDPIITDYNRFEVGKLNAFRQKTSEYSVE